MKKYELTDETMSYNGRTLRRIVAHRNFDDVKKGDKGGWIETEKTFRTKVIVGFMITQKCMEMLKYLTMLESMIMHKFMIVH